MTPLITLLKNVDWSGQRRFTNRNSVTCALTLLKLDCSLTVLLIIHKHFKFKEVYNFYSDTM